MPNLLHEFMSESSTYMKLRSIYTDAKSVRETIMGSFQTATQRVDEMSRTNPYLRKTRKWFEQQRIKTGNHTAFEYDDTEFDDGVHAPNSEAHQQHHVSASEYKELIASQQAEIAKATEKQLHGQMLNHAEVMLSMDKRNSEVVASLAQTTNILSKISDRLDQIIKTRTSAAEKARQISISGAYNANGMLTIDGAMKYFSNGLVARASKMTFKQTIMSRVDEAVSERVSNVQTALLTKFLDSPVVKKMMGDTLHSRGNKDYSIFISNEYNTSAAIFDNVVRKSIVDVIPGYLKRITYVVTDQMYHVSSKGDLTLTEPKGQFENNIDATFDVSSIKTETFERLSKATNKPNRQVSMADIKEINRIIVSQYTARLHFAGERGFAASKLKDGLYRPWINHIVTLLKKTKGHDSSYWMGILQEFDIQLRLNPRYRNQLANSISRSLNRLHEMSMKAAKLSDGHERMQYTQKMFDEHALARLRQDSQQFEHDGRTLRQLIQEKVIKRESLSAYQLAHLDDVINNFADLQERLERGSEEYSSKKIKDILSNHTDTAFQLFKMLNRGINVYVFQYVDTPSINIGAMPIPDSMMVTPQEFVKPKQYTNTIDTSNIAKTLNKVLPKANTKSTNFDNLSNYDKDASNSDEQRANEIMVSLVASSKNGNIADDDIQALTSKINEIQTPAMQQSIKRIVDGVIARTKSKSIAESPIGKAFKFVFGIAKTGMSKLLKGAKLFLTDIVTRGAKILADSFGKVARGTQAIIQGFLGSEESDGIIMRPIKQAARVASVINKRVIQPINQKVVKPIAKKVKKAAKKVKDTVSDLMGKVQEVAAGFANKLTDKITQSIKKSQFGQGFMSVMEKHKRIPAQTMADDKIDEMLGLVNNDKKPSILQTIAYNLSGLKDTADEWITMKIDGIESGRKKKDKGTDKEDEDPTSQKSLGFDLGKVLGGITSMLGGVLQAALTVILSMEAVKNIMALGKDILEHALKPLNSLFQKLLKVLKPIAETITKIIKEIVNDIVQIVEVLVEVVKPILELIGPLFKQIMDALKPILDLVTSLINVLMVPLTVTMKTVVVPILQTVGNTLEIIGGIVQVGLGTIITALGGILMGVGMLGKFFAKSTVYDTGKQMFEMGTNLVKNGASSIVSGMKKQVETIGNFYKGMATAILNPDALMEDKNVQNQMTTEQREVVERYNGSPMDGLYGSGDENAPYKFDDEVTEALSSLKNIVSSIFNIFNADSSTDLEKKLNDAEEASKYDQAKIDTSGMTEEEIKEIDDRAFELFKNSTTSEQLHGESDEDYRKRYEKNKAKWWTMAATEKLHTKVKSVADGNDAGAVNMINETMGEYDAETGTYKNMGSFANSMFASLDKVSTTEFEQLNTDLVSSMATASQGGYEDEWYYEGGTGDILKAASETFVATRKAAGHYLQTHGETIRNVKFDDGMTIDVVSAMCTGMLAAIVKRMGYYLPAHGQAYTDTYQGDPYMTPTIGPNSWGLDNADGRPNIYNRDGTKSADWTIVKDGSHQSGDLTFAIKSAGAVHGHMPVFQNDSGYWFGFNGGRYDSRENSVRLGEYYLSHGALPPGSNPGIQTEGSPYDQQIGALAAPLAYKIRYTGPKEKMRRRVRRTSGASSAIGGSKEDWIRTVAMMFEGYYYNGDKYYDNVNTHTFRIRDGRTVKARPDCSGMLGAAMTAMGYQLDYPPSSTHYNVTGCNNTLNFIHDPDGSVSKDWQLIKFNGHNLEPGDITGNTAHASFPITNLEAGFPLGMDAGGTDNIRQSAIAARAYLDGETNIPWRSAMGSGSFTKVGGAKNIVRYVGGGNTAGITRPAATTRRTTTTRRNVRTINNSTANTNTSALRGSSNAEKIWNYFRGKGLTAAGTAGLMGNLDAESGLRPNNLEDIREGKLGSDTVYTSRVDSGAYKNFTTDNAGYGLAQWTVSDRKSPLYQYKTSRGTSIGDLGMQLDYLNTELTGKFAGINSVLRTTSDVNAASDKVLREFERPAVLNYQARRNKAMSFYNKFGSGDEEAVYDEWDEPFDPIPMETLAAQLPAIQEHQNPDDMYIPELEDWKFDDMEPMAEEPPAPIIINQYADTAVIQDYIDEILSNEYEIEAPVIKQLVNDIMTELPEYLEDDDDDEYPFTEEDDLMIRQLVSAFM